MGRDTLIGLVDTDILAYRYGLLHDDWGNPVPLSKAQELILGKLSFIRDRLGLTEVYMVQATGSGSFRKNLYPDYKKHRTEPPQIVHDLKAWLRDPAVWPMVVSHESYLETDDFLGLAAGPGRIIISSDKDLLQITGEHYNPVTDRRSTVYPEGGELMFWYQVLVGDTSDGYPGCGRIGKARAYDILMTCREFGGSYAEVVHATYLLAGHTTDYLRIMMQLAWISRVDAECPAPAPIPQHVLKILEKEFPDVNRPE